MSLYSGGWLCEAMAQTSKRASGPLLRRWCCPVWCLPIADKGLEAAVDLQEIEISANDIRQLVVSWLAQGRPSPTPNQLQSLVDQKVTEEVLFGDALALASIGTMKSSSAGSRKRWISWRPMSRPCRSRATPNSGNASQRTQTVSRFLLMQVFGTCISWPHCWQTF